MTRAFAAAYYYAVAICVVFMDAATCAPLPSHYEVLGVLPTATANQLRKAYHARALQLHPDKRSAGAGATGASASDAFIQVQTAYGVLKNPQTRRAYDASLGVGGSGGWSFDGQNWAFQAAAGESVDLAEAMRALRRHQEYLERQRVPPPPSPPPPPSSPPIFLEAPHVTRLAPDHLVGEPFHAARRDSAWLILACTERRKNCRKHEPVIRDLSERLHRDGVVGVRIGFLDCGMSAPALAPAPASICTALFQIEKVSLVSIRRGAWARKDGSGVRAERIRINNRAPLKLSSLHEYALHMMRRAAECGVEKKGSMA